MRSVYAKLRLKLKPRGMIISGPLLQSGQWMANVRVAKWYIPILMFKGLRQTTIPRRYWPLLYWQYYVERRWKAKGEP